MPSVTEKAMLVSLSIRSWTATRHDKRISQEVAENHGSDIDMGRYQKRLVAKETLEEIKAIAHSARTHHYENTLPWSQDGAQILPAAMYFDYITAQHDFQRKYEAAVKRFAAEYPRVRQEAKQRLNDLFNDNEYPLEDTIADYFSYNLKIGALPDAKDFRVALGDAEVAAIKAEIEAGADAGVRTAVTGVWQRIYDLVKTMSEKLHAYDATIDANGKPSNVSNPFRDSLVENLRALVGMLPQLNFTGSNALAAMQAQLERELCVFEAVELRQDKMLREDVAHRADAILATVSDYLA
jgi:hypothetical protein